MTKNELAKRNDRLLSEQVFRFGLAAYAILFVVTANVFSDAVPETEPAITISRSTDGLNCAAPSAGTPGETFTLSLESRCIKTTVTSGDQVSDTPGISLQNGSFNIKGQGETMASILNGNWTFNPVVSPFIRRGPQIHAENLQDALQTQALKSAMRSDAPTGRLFREPKGSLQIQRKTPRVKLILSLETPTIVYRTPTTEELLSEAVRIWCKIHSTDLE